MGLVREPNTLDTGELEGNVELYDDGQRPPTPAASTGAGAGSSNNGTYTPVVTGITNVDAVSAVQVFSWVRIGGILIVAGQFDVDHTATGTPTIVDISLPTTGVSVPTFAAVHEASGIGSSDGSGNRGGIVQAKAVSKLLRYTYRGVGTQNETQSVVVHVKL
jgi:hypothetical protein